MATYSELYGLQSNHDLQQRVAVAIVIAADTIRAEDVATTNHANRMIWAKGAFGNAKGLAPDVLMALLAANKDANVAAIEGATDAAIQTAVDNVVNVFAGE